jgi:hypothetical protein
VGTSRILKITDISDEPAASTLTVSPTMKMEKIRFFLNVGTGYIALHHKRR